MERARILIGSFRITGVLGLVVLSACLALGENDCPNVELLIQKLGSNRPGEREGAAEKLKAIGEPALEALYDATFKSADAEVRRSAASLVEVIESRLHRVLAWQEPKQPGALGVAVAPDGLSAVSGMAYGHIIQWDLRTGKELRWLRDGDTVYCLVFTPDGTRLVSGHVGRKESLMLWDFKRGMVLRRFKGMLSSVHCVAVSPDGGRIVAGCDDGVVIVWDIETGRVLRELDEHHAGVVSVVFTKDGSHVVSGTEGDEKVIVWDLATGKPSTRFKGYGAGLALSPDGRLLATGGGEAIHLRVLATGKEVRRLSTPEVTCLVFSRDGRRIASGGKDGMVRLWDVESGKEVRTFTGHTAQVYSLAFTPDGRWLLSGADDRALRLWRLPK